MRLLIALALVAACAPQETQGLPSLDRDESINPAQVLPEIPVLQAPPGQEPVPTEVTGDEELAGAFAGLARVMAAMRQASTRAGDAASSPCEAGRASYVAAVQAATDTLDGHPLPGGRSLPELEIAAPQRYAELCASLPAGLQRCARFDYKTTHANECETARLAVAGEVRTAFDELAHPAEEPAEPSP